MNFIYFFNMLIVIVKASFCKRKTRVMDISPLLSPLFDLSLDVEGELQ